MTELAELLRNALSAGAIVALPLAFLGGVVTGLSPCCLPLYPVAAVTCCAARCERPRTAIWNAGAFVAGIAAATTVLGVIAALAGGALTAVGGWPRYAIAFVPLLMAVHLLGWLRLPIPALAAKGGRPGVAGAFVAGLLLSLVFAPCGTPVLASVLSYAAYEGSVPYGAVLLFLFGLGAGVPTFIIGTMAGGITARLGSGEWRFWIDRGAGAMLLAIGFFLLWMA